MLKLYVMVRTDAESMTPGRVAAQVAHAGTAVALVDIRLQLEYEYEGTLFPNTIVIDGNNLKNIPKPLLLIGYNEIIDPNYAIKDGDNVFYVEFLTALYWLVETDDTSPGNLEALKILKSYPLYTG